MKDRPNAGKISDCPGRVVAVRTGETVVSAARRMRDRKVGCLVVNDAQEKLVGIVTERDIVGRVIAEQRDAQACPVQEIMTPNVLSCDVEASLRQAGEIMAENHIRHLPVVKDGVTVGVLSSRDVIQQQLLMDRAMRFAAEQVAILCTSLRSLDLDEVIEMVVTRMPEVFEAQRAALCFPDAGMLGGNAALVRCRGCLCPEKDLRSHSAAALARRKTKAAVTATPRSCREAGAQSSAVFVPLEVLGVKQRDGKLGRKYQGCFCMCGMDLTDPSERELTEYKAMLVREIINTNLSNARAHLEIRRGLLTDALTNVGNRRAFDQKLEAERARSDRNKESFCVAVVDVDNFKTINDRLGHEEGDKALIELASCMSRAVRASDVVARYGGDEFVLLLPETKLDGAQVLLERVRTLVKSIHLGERLSMTISAGLAEYDARAAVSVNELVRRADLEMYKAKRSGRDRVEVYRDSAQSEQQSLLETEEVKDLWKKVTDVSMQSKETFVQSIWGLVRALEARDPFTRSHSENVMRYSVGIAETMSISAEEMDIIRRAAMIHDIGKIGIPDAILRKPENLTPEERRIMEQHPLIAVRILDQMRFLEREIPCVRCHHERWDGKGYPDGMAGRAIPLGARVLAVADVFDALTSDRVHRRSLPLSKAVSVLMEGSASQFDPDVVKAMVAWVEKVAEQCGGLDRANPADLLRHQVAFSMSV